MSTSPLHIAQQEVLRAINAPIQTLYRAPTDRQRNARSSGHRDPQRRWRARWDGGIPARRRRYWGFGGFAGATGTRGSGGAGGNAGTSANANALSPAALSESCWVETGLNRSTEPALRRPQVMLSNPADGDRPLDGRPPRICITTAASRRRFLAAEEVPACYRAARRTVRQPRAARKPDNSSATIKLLARQRTAQLTHRSNPEIRCT